MRDLRRHLGGVLSVLIGCAVLGALLVVLNRKVQRAGEVLAGLDAEIAMPERKEKPKEEQPLQRRKKAPPARSRTAPRPALSTDLSGLGSGLALFDVAAVGDLAGELLGDTKDAEEMVMTAETVDTKPRPAATNRAPTAPAEAQRKRVSGYVVLRLLIDERGGVQDARVIDSQPAGFFDDAVMQVAPTWRFEPATYRGRPVSLRVDQTIRFDLG